MSPKSTDLRPETGGDTTPGAPVRAVLWDLDGTLVDTEAAWIAAEDRLVAEFGGDWDDRESHSLIGNPLPIEAAYLRAHAHVELPEGEIIDRLVEDATRALEADVEWCPGARELLAELREAGIPSGLVTMAYRAFADAVVAQLPTGTFAAQVTGDEVTHAKPHPEPYLLAAKRLGVQPRHSVAIEDSPRGVESAERAGCVVLAVNDERAVPPAPTRTVVASLAEVSVADLARIAAAAQDIQP